MGGARKRPAVETPERPECPWQFQHIWQWFWDVLNGCPATGMGPATIGWRDLVAWKDLTGEHVKYWEARLMIRLSVMRANIEGEDRAKKPKGK